jgi:NAD(P)-dependent dehydrogenase (short-subunit alcohol dehydrogenase family)
MIILVGANASIAQELSVNLAEKELYLLGRSRPSWLDQHVDYQIGFLESDYKSVDCFNNILDGFHNLTIIFVGISASPNLIINIESDEFLHELESNLLFAVKICKKVLPKMIADRFGRFVFLGSKESSRGITGAGTYAIIKQGQIGLSRTLAVEYAKFGITSNVVQLGLLNGGLRHRIKSAKELANLKARIPTSEIIETHEIAQLIKTLIATKSMNGTVIDLDQGVR